MKLPKVEAEPVHTVSRFRQQIPAILLSLSVVILAAALVSQLFEPRSVASLALTLGALLLSILGAAGFFLDVRRERQDLDAFLAVSPNPVLIADAQGLVSYANPAYEQWAGRSGASLQKQNVFEHVLSVHPSDRIPPLGGIIVEAIRAGRVWSGMVAVPSLAGAPLTAFVVVAPLRGRPGRTVGSLWMYSDVTEQQRLVSELYQSQEKYRLLVENSQEGIVIVQDTAVVFANAAAAAIFGYASAKAMERVKFADMVAPPSRPFVFGSMDGRELGELLLRNYELKGLTRTGAVIDLEVNAKNASWGDKMAVQASFRDVTERKELEREQAQWFWEQEVLAAIDRQLVSVVDPSLVFEMISHHARSLTRADWAGVLVFHAGGQVAEWRAIRGSVEAGVGVRVDLSRFESVLRSAQEPVLLSDARAELGDRLADLFPFDPDQVISIAWIPLKIDQLVRGQLVLVFHRRHTFTDREQRLLVSLAEKSSLALANADLYEKLLRHEGELRLLSGSRVNAQEEERRRLARELHDGLGQMLTAIKFNIEVLEDAKNLTGDDRKKLADVRGLLEGAMKETREISHNLMPSVLEDFGLGPALQVLCEQIADASGLSVRFLTHGNVERLEERLETGLYRITQEALNNTIKHAGASEIEAQLIAGEESIRLTVADNGKGFDVDEVGRRSGLSAGLGLVSMRERAVSLGGSFHLESRPGSGTEILVELPLVRS